MRRVLPALLLLGCSDYELHGDDDPVDTPDTDVDEPDPDDTDAVPDDDCEDRAIPGYATSSDACVADEVETFEPVLEWTYDTFSVAPTSRSVMMTPVVAPLVDTDGDGDADDDDVPAILFVTYVGTDWSGEGVIRALHGDGSGEIWSVVGESIDGCSGLAAGDLDGDGDVEIVAVTWNKLVKAFDHLGNLLWTSGQYAAQMASYSSMPSIADLDADGSPEVIVGGLVLNADGTTRFAGSAGRGAGPYYGTTSFAADLDGDGDQEVITGRSAYDADGNVVASTSMTDGYVAVADFDGDGAPEIVVSGNGRLRVHEADYTLRWTATIPGATSETGGPPTVADFDGDGAPEIGVAATSTYTVFDGDGTVLWTNTTIDGSSGVTGSSVYDFEGDGVAEVVYADERVLYVFAGPDGATKLSSPDHSSWTVVEYPVIADVDGDRHAEIVVGRNMHPSWPSAAKYGIAVYGDAADAWRPGRGIWNQHAYAITNVGDDGAIPAVPDRNWLTYNNFRSGDLGSGGSVDARPDLTLAQGDLCEIDCDEDRLIVWVHPGNQGAADAPAGSEVALYAVIGGSEVRVGEQTVGVDLPAGWYADAVAFDVQGYDPTTFEALVLRISGAVDECDPDNDELRWDGPFCP